MAMPIEVTVVTRLDTSDIEQVDYDKINLKIMHRNPFGRDVLDELTVGDYDHVLTLSDYTVDAEAADARTLLQLIHLRDINSTRTERFKITSEIRTPENERLARVSDARDYVVGTRIISIMLVQLAKNHLAWKIFAELLGPAGNEISIAPAGDYLPLDGPVDFYEMTAAAAQAHDLVLGYETIQDGVIRVVLNPEKSTKVTLNAEDRLVVLTETASA